MDIFVAVNLDLRYILELMKFNFEETFCSCCIKKEKEKEKDE